MLILYLIDLQAGLKYGLVKARKRGPRNRARVGRLIKTPCGRILRSHTELVCLNNRGQVHVVGQVLPECSGVLDVALNSPCPRQGDRRRAIDDVHMRERHELSLDVV